MVINLKWQGRRYDNEKKTEYPFFDVSVPGNIQCDYAKYMNLSDLMFSDNVTALEETEGWYWEYRTELKYSCSNDEKVYFVSQGIDYMFDICINGKVIYSHEGMFTKIEIDLSNISKSGDTLSVIIYPHPKRPGEYIQMRDLASECCKPAVYYGWDFQPRLLSSGLWKPAYLEIRDNGYIEKCEPTYILNDDRTVANVHFDTICNETVKYTITDPNGKVIYSGNEENICIDDVMLWWCNGQGKQNLYSWTAETNSHKVSGKIGFRTIKLVQNIGSNYEPEGFPKSCYPIWITIELNGRRIFGKGSNLTNIDMFPANVTDERCKFIVDSAKEANMNIIRLWGGGEMQKDSFYDYCDENGIMIWQEFPLACNAYVDKPEYLKILKQEATAMIEKLRSHACLILWCGGNELFNGWSVMDMQSKPIRLLNKLCFELDENRPFLDTSPLCGMGHGGYRFRQDGENVFKIFRNSHNTAYTEFGVPSFAPMEQLKKIIPEDEISVPKKSKSWEFHHAFGAWGNDSWGAMEEMSEYFGEINSTEKAVKYSQWLQSAGLKAIFEEARKQWPYCSMSINWVFNEPWITAANNSIISYPNVKKPAYYSVKKALQSCVASARIPDFFWKGGEVFTAEIWMLNDSEETINENVNVYLELGENRYELLNWKSGEVKPMTNKIGNTVNFVLPDVYGTEELKLVLDCGNEMSNSYILHYSPSEEYVRTGQLNV